LISVLKNKFPTTFGTYIDPFLGAGAIPLWLRPKNACLSDANEELIVMHIAIRDHVQEVINFLHRHCDDRNYYYALRAQNWRDMSPAEIAARMIYLNHTCFNGLYRVNKAGTFNASYATPPQKGRKIYDPDRLIALSNALSRYDIRHCDFRVTLKLAQEGDLVFLDPPYYGSYAGYTANKFSEDDQRYLAKEFKRLVDLGCYVIACNASNKFIYSLYSDHVIETINVRRAINCKKDQRTGTEVLIYSRNEIPANDEILK